MYGIINNLLWRLFFIVYLIFDKKVLDLNVIWWRGLYVIFYNYFYDEFVLYVFGLFGLWFCEGVLFWEEVVLKWIIYFYNEIRLIISGYDNW